MSEVTTKRVYQSIEEAPGEGLLCSLGYGIGDYGLTRGSACLKVTSFKKGTYYNLDEILAKAKSVEFFRNIEITGEDLFNHPHMAKLVSVLNHHGYRVNIISSAGADFSNYMQFKNVLLTLQLGVPSTSISDNNLMLMDFIREQDTVSIEVATPTDIAYVVSVLENRYCKGTVEFRVDRSKSDEIKSKIAEMFIWSSKLHMTANNNQNKIKYVEV